MIALHGGKRKRGKRKRGKRKSGMREEEKKRGFGCPYSYSLALYITFLYYLISCPQVYDVKPIRNSALLKGQL